MRSGLLLKVYVCGALIALCAPLRDLGYTGLNCDTTKGNPKNVHEVRPADISIVAAIGDSLSAGFGAGATSSYQVNVQYRGLTFVMGGDRNLSEHITVPNILKTFNPNLFGQAYGQSSADVWELARLDAAVGGARAMNMPEQARSLVSRMQHHADQVDMQNSWKLIHIFIGANDACYYCKSPPSNTSTSHPTAYKRDIETAIQTIYDYIPRSIVSIVAMLNIDMLSAVDKTSPTCEALHRTECACDAPGNLVDVPQLCADYRKGVMEIQNEGKFERDDFTVVVQPMFADVHEPPLTSNAQADTTFFAPDCFHFSQYGHAAISRMLWNNLLQPVGSKISNYSLSDSSLSLICPDVNCPYIRTVKNSVNC